MKFTQRNTIKTEITRRGFLKGSAAIAGAAALQRVWPAAGSPVLRVVQQGATINVMEAPYNARGDGTSNDRAAFQAAIDAAIAAGLPLRVPKPSQFYRIALEPDHPQLLVDGNLVMVGDGRDTILRFTVQTQSAGQNYSALFVSGGSNFQLSDLRLEEDLHPPVEQFEFTGIFFESGAVDHECLLQSIDIEGFTHCVYTPASSVDGGLGELFLTVRDCDLHPWWQYCIAFWATTEGHKRLHIYDSFLHDNQHSHLVYCHPHNSVHVENTRFDGANGWAFHFQGSSVSGDPDYQRFVGCWFGPRNSRAIITQDRELVTVQVEVRNCIFEAQPAIQVRSEIVIDGCYFTAPVDSSNESPFIAAYSNAPWRATIRNSIFAPKSNALPQVDLRLENVEAVIENCQFYNQASGAILALGAGGTNRYTVSECFFYNRPDNASQSVSIEIDNGQTTIQSCRFFGPSTQDRGTILCRGTDVGPSSESLLQIDNCTFQNISGGSLFYVIEAAANSWSDRIIGGNNLITNYQSGKPLLMTESSNPIFGHLAPIKGTAPTSIPAAPAMILSSNYDTFEVLGSADVSFLHWWTGDGLSNALFSGTITLMATGPFALVTGGNIQLAGGATRRDVLANNSISLTYDSAQGFWSEA